MFDAAKLSFSSRGKSAMRSAITSNINWAAYSRVKGISSAALRIGDMTAICAAWNIDAAAYALPNYPAESNERERPYSSAQVYDLRAHFDAMELTLNVKARNLCYDIFDTVRTKQDSTMTERQYSVIHSILDQAEGKETPRAYRKKRETPRHSGNEDNEYFAAMAYEKAKQDAANAARDNATPPPVPAVPFVPVVRNVPHHSNDMAVQLATIIANMANSAMDMESVGKIVDERINAALAAVPAVRYEVKGFDGEVRNIDGHKHPKFAVLLKAATARMASGYAPNIWIAGPAGSGKTHAGHMIANALGASFHLNGAISMPHELLGFIDAGGTYHGTPFRDAYENGGVYMFDEVDGSDNAALLALNAALANGHCAFPDASVNRHKDCIIMASANTWGLGATADYVGRTKIDAAFMSRFPVRIGWQYDTALEIAISGNEAFARRVIAARERARAAGLKVLIDPRASQAGAALIANGMAESEAAEFTYLANLTNEQRKIVEGI